MALVGLGTRTAVALGTGACPEDGNAATATPAVAVESITDASVGGEAASSVASTPCDESSAAAESASTTTSVTYTTEPTPTTSTSTSTTEAPPATTTSTTEAPPTTTTSTTEAPPSAPPPTTTTPPATTPPATAPPPPNNSPPPNYGGVPSPAPPDVPPDAPAAGSSQNSADILGDDGTGAPAANDDATNTGPGGKSDDARVADQTAGAETARTGDRGVDAGTDDRDATTRSTGEGAAPSRPGDPSPVEAQPPDTANEEAPAGLVGPPPMVSGSALALQDALRSEHLLSGPLPVAVPAGLLLGLLLVGLGVVAVRLTRPPELPHD